MSAYGKGSKVVQSKHMAAAIKDTESIHVPFWQRFAWQLCTVAVVLVVGASSIGMQGRSIAEIGLIL